MSKKRVATTNTAFLDKLGRKLEKIEEKASHLSAELFGRSSGVDPHHEEADDIAILAEEGLRMISKEKRGLRKKK